jgi:autotransporter adhesin
MNPETYDSRDPSDDDEPTVSGPSTHPLGPILGNIPAVAPEPIDPARLTLLPTASPSGAGVSRPRRARIGIRTAAIGALVLVAALIATTTWAMGVKADVDRTFADASGARHAAADVAGRIQQSKSDLSKEQAAVVQADDANAKLERQVENQAICAAAQRSDLASLRKIFDDSRANFENATKGSRLFAASTAYDKAFGAAVADLTKAYRSAAAGNLSAANGWIRASNSQVSIAIKQSKALDREIDKVNTTTDRITGAQKALDERLDSTAITCGG